MNERPEYIVVGRFGRPRGVSGEIYLHPLTDNPERFRKAGIFWIESGDGWKETKITAVRFYSGKLAVRVEAVDSSEQAGNLSNKYLYIKAIDLKDLPEGSYYHFDLIGCQVVDRDGNSLGQLVDVERYPANDVWVIESEKGIRSMFPAVKSFVEKVNIERKYIVINPPEGIFDSPDAD